MVTRLLRENGFPVALRLDDPKPMQGLRVYHKPHATDTAQTLRNVIGLSVRLRPLTWKSRFDIIIYVGR